MSYKAVCEHTRSQKGLKVSSLNWHRGIQHMTAATAEALPASAILSALNDPTCTGEILHTSGHTTVNTTDHR